MLTKTASNVSHFAKAAYLTNSAREGWELILKTLDPNSTILLPSYIGVTKREGSGIYDPVTKLDVPHDFYLLNDDLSIDIGSFENTLKSKEYSLVLLVHYFGFTIPNIEQIVNICRKYKVIIVEDCAHLYSYNLTELSKTGGYGDFTFYSLHKFFPLGTGGLVVQNNLHLKIPNWNNTTVQDSLCQNFIQYDAKLIAQSRRKNFELWDEAINGINGLIKLKTMGPEDIPHNYPVVIKDGLREKLYFWLIERNMPLIALYYRLIEPLQNQEYSTMLNLSDSILNLPVHQDTEREDITILALLLKEGIQELH